MYPEQTPLKNLLWDDL